MRVAGPYTRARFRGAGLQGVVLMKGRERCESLFGHLSCSDTRVLRQMWLGTMEQESSMNYDVYGPFEIIRDGKLVDRSARVKRQFWESVEEEERGLPSAVGCYVFCIGKKPWYVGVAEKQSFRKECFQPHKINAFNSALNKQQGKPQLLLISKVTPGGSFAKAGVNGHKASRFLEDLLIGMALARNQDLENIRGTKLMKELAVPGVINTARGKASKNSVRFLKGVLRAKQ